MNILVVNDDGINAEGIDILAHHLMKYGNVIVVAPNQGRSAASHSIVISDSIYFGEANRFSDIKSYEISGTPADCVRLASSILDINFDLVFSGVNNGLNCGTDIFYSGTVAAAREGMILGIPSVAISTDFSSFDIVKNELDDLLKYIFDNKLYSKDYVLNINFPKKTFTKSLGYRFTKQGIKLYKTVFMEVENKKYKERDSKVTIDNDINDVTLGEKGYITFVPLGLDQTSHMSLDNLMKYEK